MLKHAAYARDFTEEIQRNIFHRAEQIEKLLDQPNGDIILEQMLPAQKKKRHVLMFQAKSTRTISSFDMAIQRLGGTLSIYPWEMSSMGKGESFSDMIGVFAHRNFSSFIMRYDGKEDDGIAKNRDLIQEAIQECEALGSDMRIINAGFRNLEHPTQMLLDIYTIRKHHLDKLYSENLVIVMVGDIARSRAIASLAIGLKPYRPRIHFISPPDILLPEWVKQELENEKIVYHEIHLPLEETIRAISANVYYFSRLQTNLWEDAPRDKNILKQYEKEYEQFIGITNGVAAAARSDALFMHPLPHGGEIPSWFKKDPRYKAKEQIINGDLIRMSLLWELFGENFDPEFNMPRQKKIIFESQSGDIVETAAGEIIALCTVSYCLGIQLRHSGTWGKGWREHHEILRSIKNIARKPCPEHRPAPSEKKA